MLARKIGDNVESYFDFLENALMGYAGLFQTTPPKERELDDVLAERFARHKRFGILAIVRYNPVGTGVQVFSTVVPLSAPWGSVFSDLYTIDLRESPAITGTPRVVSRSSSFRILKL